MIVDTDHVILGTGVLAVTQLAWRRLAVRSFERIADKHPEARADLLDVIKALSPLGQRSGKQD